MSAKDHNDRILLQRLGVTAQPESLEMRLDPRNPNVIESNDNKRRTLHAASTNKGALLDLTLRQIRDAGPCHDGWVRLLRSLGRYDPDRRVTLGDIAVSNGAADALWCARCLPLDDIAVRRDLVRAIVPAVRRASAHTKDVRVHACIDVVERWLGGDDVDLMTAAESAESAEEAGAAVGAEEAAVWAAVAAAVAAARAREAASRAAEAARWARAAAGEAGEARAAGEALEAEECDRQTTDIITVFGRTVDTADEAPDSDLGRTDGKMSTRSHFEINHDVFDMTASDEEIGAALRAYVRSAGREQAARLARIGLVRFWWGHHSAAQVAEASLGRGDIETI